MKKKTKIFPSNRHNNVLSTIAMVELSFILARCFNALYHSEYPENAALADQALINYKSLRKRIGYNTKTNARHGAYKAWEFMQGK